MTTLPPVLKPIQPFIQRANELEQKAPLVAFYCRTYAVQEGLPLISAGSKDKAEAESFLIELMDQLESTKKSLNPNPEEGRATVEIFALKMFKKADDEDRKGVHTATVAKLFYAASILMQSTKQFGELSEDIVEKLKYAKWKAAEITKAIKTGETIQPGGFGEVKSEEVAPISQENSDVSHSEESWASRFEDKKNNDAPPTNVYQIDPFAQIDPFNQQSKNIDFGKRLNEEIDPFAPLNTQPKAPKIDPFEDHRFDSKPSKQVNDVVFKRDEPVQNQYVQQYLPPQVPKQEPFVPPPKIVEQPKPQPKPVVKQEAPKQVTSKPVEFKDEHALPKDIPVENIIKAQQLAKYVISSLQFPDVPTAVKYLEEALALLKK
jgi:vacuolar protein sorting-associated protein VTA1